MPHIVKSMKQREWDFANELAKFFPEKLGLATNSTNGYPFVREKGFIGFLKGGVASFSGYPDIKIQNTKWKEPLLEAVKKYEEKNGITVTVEESY